MKGLSASAIVIDLEGEGNAAPDGTGWLKSLLTLIPVGNLRKVVAGVAPGALGHPWQTLVW